MHKGNNSKLSPLIHRPVHKYLEEKFIYLHLLKIGLKLLRVILKVIYRWLIDKILLGKYGKHI